MKIPLAMWCRQKKKILLELWLELHTFTLSSLPVLECSMSLHLFIYFKTSVLRFTSYSSYKHFVRFIPRYFIFWSYCKWCCVLNFSIQLFIAPKWKYDWCFSFGFVACDLANSLIRSRRFFVDSLGIFYTLSVKQFYFFFQICIHFIVFLALFHLLSVLLWC